jgi:lipopolysaccharide export system permease protein
MASRRLIFRTMRLLDRYLFRELLTPLAYILGALLVLGNCFSLFGELQELQDRKLHFLDVIEYCVAITPEFLVMILPITLLLALLYTLTDLSRSNQITAMRAAGISLWRICAPYFFVGCALSMVLFGLNEFLVPRSSDWKNHILTRYVQKPGDIESKNEFRNFGFKNERDRRAWFIGEYRVNTREMLKPQVHGFLPDGSIYRLYADRAVRTNGVWTFFNVAEYSQANATAQLVPSLQTNELAMPEFDETPRQILSEIKITSYQGLKKTRSSDIPLADIVAYLRLHPNLSRADSGWLFTKFHGRLAAPWTCFVVVLIAIPFGATTGRRNLFVGVAGSIFICFGYFVIQQTGLALGSGGYLPAWLAAWLPNLIFGALGLALMIRAR